MTGTENVPGDENVPGAGNVTGTENVPGTEECALRTPRDPPEGFLKIPRDSRDPWGSLGIPWDP